MVDGIKGTDPLLAGLTARSNANAQKLETAKTQLGSATKESADDPKTKKAAKDFEALLLHQMLNSMWSMVPKGGMLSGSNEEEMYHDMLNEGIANDIAEKQSIGIQDVILRELRGRENK